MAAISSTHSCAINWIQISAEEANEMKHPKSWSCALPLLEWVFVESSFGCECVSAATVICTDQRSHASIVFVARGHWTLIKHLFVWNLASHIMWISNGTSTACMYVSVYPVRCTLLSKLVYSRCTDCNYIRFHVMPVCSAFVHLWSSSKCAQADIDAVRSLLARTRVGKS